MTELSERIVAMIRGGQLLSAEMIVDFVKFCGQLSEEQQSKAREITDRARAADADYINEAINRLDKKGYQAWVKYIRSADELADETVEKCMQLARKASKSGSKPKVEALLDLCPDISGDLVSIVRSAYFNLEGPYLNWELIHYRSGRIPRYGFPVEGKFADFLEMPRDRALKIIDEGERTAQAEIEGKNDLQNRLKQEVAQVKGLPSSTLLRQTTFEKEPVVWIATTEEELKGKTIPAVWKELVQAQDKHQSLPWEEIWGPVQDRLPAVQKLLTEKCLGVAVLEVEASAKPRQRSSLRRFTGPLLAYVFESRHQYGPYGRAFEALVGGHPLEKRPVKHPLFSHFPESLQTFYVSVHDGWCTGGTWDGPWPLAQVQLLIDRMSDTAEFEKNKKRPFSMRDMIDLVETGNGDAICLDIKRSTKKDAIGCYFFHEDLEESTLDQDFWGMINKRIEDVVMPGYLPAKR